MDNTRYMNMLYKLDDAFDHNNLLLIEWENGLKVKCLSITGTYETDTEPEDEDYIGEHAAVVEVVEIIEGANDNSVSIYNDCIEISLKCIPSKITSEDGTVLWENN